MLKLSLALITALVTLGNGSAFGQNPDPASVLTPNTMGINGKLVRAVIENLYDKGDFADIQDFFDVDFVNHDPDPAILPGVDGFKQRIVGLRLACPDLSFTIDELLETGDRVIVRGTLQGINSGPFFSNPPSGLAIETGVIQIYKIQKNRIIECWNQLDQFGMVRQVGLLPPNLMSSISGGSTLTPAVAPLTPGSQSVSTSKSSVNEPAQSGVSHPKTPQKPNAPETKKVKPKSTKPPENAGQTKP